MFNVRSALKLSAVIFSVPCAFGCGEQIEEPATPVPAMLVPSVSMKELAQGLNIFKMEGMISGAYRKADQAIYFETHRGAPRQEFYKNAYPELGDYELDILVLDKGGRVVYLQQGGDALAPDWERALEREDKLPLADPLRRADDMELVKEWSVSMETADLPSALAAEKRAIAQTKFAVRDDMLKPAIEEAMHAVVYRPDMNQIAIHTESIIGGEHSAHYSNQRGYLIDACNHGRCASAMPRKCKINTPAYKQYPNSNCGTPYWFSSQVGFHNCHDDTIRAVWGMRWGDQGSNGSGVCINPAVHFVSPDCTTTNW